MQEEIQYYVQELGSIQMVGNQSVYLVTENVEKGLMDLKRRLKEENQAYPYVSYQLGKLGVFEQKLIPILGTQRENKEIVYNVFIILVYLTEPLKVDNLKDFR